MRNQLGKLSLSLALLAGTAMSNGLADICVNAQLKTSTLRGIVIGHHKGEEKALAGATVQLRQFRNDEWHAIAQVQANQAGEFEFSQVRPGKYEVIANSTGYVPTGAYVSLIKKRGRNEKIVFTLRMPLEGCGDAKMESYKD
jgi:hypothetical protein